MDEALPDLTVLSNTNLRVGQRRPLTPEINVLGEFWPSVLSLNPSNFSNFKGPVYIFQLDAYFDDLELPSSLPVLLFHSISMRSAEGTYQVFVVVKW